MLWYKRLERGRFKLPQARGSATTVALDGPSLAMLLDGIDYARVLRPAHWRPKNASGDRHGSPNVIQPKSMSLEEYAKLVVGLQENMTELRKTVEALRADLAKRDGMSPAETI